MFGIINIWQVCALYREAPHYLYTNVYVYERFISFFLIAKTTFLLQITWKILSTVTGIYIMIYIFWGFSTDIEILFSKINWKQSEHIALQPAFQVHYYFRTIFHSTFFYNLILMVVIPNVYNLLNQISFPYFYCFHSLLFIK